MTNASNHVLYIGVTNDIDRRVAEHREDMADGFTRAYQCHKLVYVEQCHDVRQAIDREKQIKGWRRARKVALINAQNPPWMDLGRDPMMEMK